MTKTILNTVPFGVVEQVALAPGLRREAGVVSLADAGSPGPFSRCARGTRPDRPKSAAGPTEPEES